MLDDSLTFLIRQSYFHFGINLYPKNIVLQLSYSQQISVLSNAPNTHASRSQPLVISNAKVGTSNLHVQHIFLHIVRNTCRRFSQNQNFLDAFWALSIHPKLKKLWKQRQLVQYFPGKVPRLSETFPKCEPFNQKFQTFGSKVPFGTGSGRKLKPDVLIEWNGAHAKVTKFVTNCAPFARARESSTKKVSQVKFSFSMVNEVMIQPD